MKSKLKAENKVVKSGDVQIIKAKVFKEYNYIIETNTSSMFVNEQELGDLEKCLFLLKGWEIQNKPEIPMGISQWIAHGKKYGYDKFKKPKKITKK